MSGNVFEWVNDSWRISYTADGQTDPEGGDPEIADRLARGGCWYAYESEARVSIRSHEPDPSIRYDWMGFRLTRTVP